MGRPRGGGGEQRATPAYRSAVASVINRVARAYAGADIPRAVNRAYLQFFLPFWWEHILERGRLDEPAAEKPAILTISELGASNFWKISHN